MQLLWGLQWAFIWSARAKVSSTEPQVCSLTIDWEGLARAKFITRPISWHCSPVWFKPVAVHASAFSSLHKHKDPCPCLQIWVQAMLKSSSQSAWNIVQAVFERIIQALSDAMQWSCALSIKTFLGIYHDIWTHVFDSNIFSFQLVCYFGPERMQPYTVSKHHGHFGVLSFMPTRVFIVNLQNRR